MSVIEAAGRSDQPCPASVNVASVSAGRHGSRVQALVTDHVLGARAGASSHERAQRELFVRCRAGDLQAREHLIMRFMPVAERLTRRYLHSGEPADDLIQVATIGLIKAVDRYDADRECAFLAYATPTILGEIKRHFRDHTWSVRVPHTLRTLAVQVDKGRTALAESLGREPTVPELAAAFGISDVQIVEALHARGAYRALSFDTPSPRSRTAGERATSLGDAIGVDEHGYEHAEQCATLARLLPTLTSRDRDVLRMRFGHDMTQTQIATALGVSQMQISRIIRQAIGDLRAISESQRATQAA
jgi:RNA polymerase sigma-B factor